MQMNWWSDGKNAKKESPSDDDDETAVRVKREPSEEMDLFAVMRNVLTKRGNSEIVKLAKKLDQQGINQTSSLKVLSKSLLERKLSEKWDTLGDVADVMEVWTVLQQGNKGNGKAGNSKGSSKGKKGGKSSRGRSRSPRGRDQRINQTSSLKVLTKSLQERNMFEKWDTLGDVADVMEVWTALQQGNGKAGNSKRSSKGKKGGKSSRGKSRSPKGRDQQRGRGATPRSSSKASLGGRSPRDEEPLPLWTAIIEEDDDEVQRLLRQGVNIELRHQNWTPLMAACERGYFSIALLLLEKGADTSAVNRKGRCALSFAAAPSKDEQQKDQRPSQLDIIKLLSQHGAKIDRKDDRGRTPRAHAEAEARAPATTDPRWKRAQAARMLADLENA